jgi:uncharacterized protein YuzE
MKNKPKIGPNLKKLGLKYDRASDSLYLAIKEGPEDNFIELAPNINLEYNKKREIIGFEILNFTDFLKNRNDSNISEILKVLDVS